MIGKVNWWNNHDKCRDKQKLKLRRKNRVEDVLDTTRSIIHNGVIVGSGIVLF